MGKDLFEGIEDNDDISKIKINKEFAQRFEHNKKREDLQRLEELKKKGLVQDSDDSSEESDEEEEILANLNKNDLQFYNMLVNVRKNDPLISQKDIKFYDSDGEESQGSKAKVAKEKPLYLKDVVAKHLIESGSDVGKNELEPHVKSYAQEQEEIRRGVLKAVQEAEEADNGDGGDLFTEKKSIQESEDDYDDGGGELHKKLNEYFGEDENLSENEMFLKDYLLKKKWLDKDKEKKPDEDYLEEFSEEEDELEMQDKYEAVYNFRYEEGAGDRVLGHARFVEGSVRKKTNARQLQRKNKEERMAQKELEMKEEVKHLKNLKMKEIMEKLEKIKSIAGLTDGGACALNEDDLEKDFDPDVYDKKMNETFSENYYDADDIDPQFGSDADDDERDLEKPDFDKEDELLGLPKGWDVCKSGDGFLATRERILKDKKHKRDAEPLDELEEEEIVPEKGKRKRKRKISLHDKVAIEKELEEYYKLDYEDTIGDLKTRFRYTSVPSNRYGLTTEEVLALDEKDLNQYVSLKKIAPYRQNEWKVSKQKRYHLKTNKKMLLQGKVPKYQESRKKKNSKSFSKEQEETQLDEVNGDVQLSRRKRRRQRQSELKISHQRSLAYAEAKKEKKKG